jgi:hypothetical protein
VRLSHTLARTSAVFDDPDLVAHGGLVLVVVLAERGGLPELPAERVRPGGGCGRSGLQMSARREGRGIILDIQGLRGLEGVPSLWCG